MDKAEERREEIFIFLSKLLSRLFDFNPDPELEVLPEEVQQRRRRMYPRFIPYVEQIADVVPPTFFVNMERGSLEGRVTRIIPSSTGTELVLPTAYLTRAFTPSLPVRHFPSRFSRVKASPLFFNARVSSARDIHIRFQTPKAKVILRMTHDRVGIYTFRANTKGVFQMKAMSVVVAKPHYNRRRKKEEVRCYHYAKVAKKSSSLPFAARKKKRTYRLTSEPDGRNFAPYEGAKFLLVGKDIRPTFEAVLLDLMNKLYTYFLEDTYPYAAVEKGADVGLKSMEECAFKKLLYPLASNLLSVPSEHPFHPAEDVNRFRAGRRGKKDPFRDRLDRLAKAQDLSTISMVVFGKKGKRANQLVARFLEPTNRPVARNLGLIHHAIKDMGWSFDFAAAFAESVLKHRVGGPLGVHYFNYVVRGDLHRLDAWAERAVAEPAWYGVDSDNCMNELLVHPRIPNFEVPKGLKSIREYHDYVSGVRSLTFKAFREENRLFRLFKHPEFARFDGWNVAGYTLRMPDTNWELQEWGNIQVDCVGNYVERVHQGRTVVFGLFKDGNLVLDMSLNPSDPYRFNPDQSTVDVANKTTWYIHQLMFKGNNYAPDELRKTLADALDVYYNLITNTEKERLEEDRPPPKRYTYQVESDREKPYLYSGEEENATALFEGECQKLFLSIIRKREEEAKEVAAEDRLEQLRAAAGLAGRDEPHDNEDFLRRAIG